jgi:hypothetical protein
MKRLSAHISGLLARVRARVLRWLRRSEPAASPGPPALPAEPPPADAPAASTSLAPAIAEQSLATAVRLVAPYESAAASAPAAATADPLAAGRERMVAPVRQFFARMAAAGPEGLAVDFAKWGSAPVERFFMALGHPDRGERRGPVLTSAASIREAFAEFVWD